MSPFLLAVMGPTGSGKSAVAEAVADETGAALVNADAFQVYRGLDIGTNKPSDTSRYELIDVVGPEDDFGLGHWIRLCLSVLEESYRSGRSVIVVGGTGLYVRALFEEYADIGGAPDSGLRASLMQREREEGLASLASELQRLGRSEGVDLSNPVRVRRALEKALGGGASMQFHLPPFRRVKVALVPPVGPTNEAIDRRVSRMWEAGWPDEVASLLACGVPETAPSFRAIGYQSVASFLRGQSTRKETEAVIAQQTRQYAKRQRTWLRTEPLLSVIERESVEERTCRLSASDVLRLL